jgi:hypothetical protein
VGGAAGKPDETAEHLKKVAGGAVRCASVAIWWKKRIPPGNGAARRHGGDLVGGGRDTTADLGEMLVLLIWMARGVFGRSRHPRSLGFDRVRRTKNTPRWMKF